MVVRISTQQPSKLAGINANRMMALMYLRRYSEALEANYSSYKAFKGFGDIDGMSTAITQRGQYYLERGSIRKATLFYEQAKKLDIKTNNIRGQGICEQTLGQLYCKQGNLPKALEAANKGAEIAEQLEDIGLEGNCYITLGNIVFEAAKDNQDRETNLDAAKAYYKYAKECTDHTKQPSKQISARVNLGAVLIEQKLYEEAEPIFNEAITLCGKNNIMGKSVLAYRNLAFIQLQKSNYPLANDNLDKAFKYWEEQPSIEQRCDLLQLRAKILQKTNKHLDAISELETAKNLAERYGLFPVVTQCEKSIKDMC